AVVATTTVENSIEKTVIEKDKELPKQVSDTKTTDEGAVTAMGDDKQQPIKEEPTIQKEEITILSEEKSTAKNDMTSQKDEIVSIKEEIVQSSEDNENSLKAKEDIIIFKVQLLASGKDLSLIPSNFKGLSTISKEPYKNLYRYMYGETQSYEQAQLFKAGATSKGYSTCYIVAYKEGKRIPVPEALKYLSQ
ncbi:MAG: N-acetylmuramoyl-L-alanine amidase, partial [Eudoraea sp.]